MVLEARFERETLKCGLSRVIHSGWVPQQQFKAVLFMYYVVCGVLRRHATRVNTGLLAGLGLAQCPGLLFELLSFHFCHLVEERQPGILELDIMRSAILTRRGCFPGDVWEREQINLYNVAVIKQKRSSCYWFLDLVLVVVTCHLWFPVTCLLPLQ